MSSQDSDDDVATRLRRRHGTGEAVPSFSIEVVDGPERGQRFVVGEKSAGRVLVGTSPACEIRLSDPEVSRRHAALDIGERGLRITDLDSTNGTFVGRLAVVDAWLSGDERVRVGSTELQVERITKPLENKLQNAMSFGRMLGSSAVMRRLYPLCEKLAASDVPLVIEGETGTGKEHLAEAIHEASARAKGPFVVFDCTAVAPSLVESALFGHERGAFTGATERHKGVFEQAHGGTLLIDEIGDLEIALQAKLLRAIERSEVKRVGGTGFVKVDVRVLSATRRDLDREVAAGRFRDDLFFRLAVARIELPPLRARHGDVALLARHFWHLHGGGTLPDDLARRFEDYPWPGNVRELQNTVARHLALGPLASHESMRPPRARSIEPTHTATSPHVTESATDHEDVVDEILALDLPLPEARQRVVDHFLKRYVERVLAKHGGNVVRAAAASGIARRYFDLIRARQRD